MNIYTKLTLDYLRRNKRRTTFILLGIMLSVGLISSTSTFFVSFSQQIVEQTKKDAGSYHLIVKHASPQVIEHLKANASIEQIGLVHEEKVKLSNGKILQIQQMDQKAYELIPFSILEQVPDESGGLMIAKRSLPLLGKQFVLGDKLTYQTQDKQQHSTRITAILEKNPFNDYGNQSETLFAYQFMQEISDTKDISLYLKVASHANFPATWENIKGMVGEKNVTQNYRFSGSMNINSDLGNTTYLQYFPIFLVVVVTFAFIYSTFHISVAERTRHIGLLRAVGATKRNIRRMMLIEVTLLSAIGVPLGLFLGIFGLWLVVWVYRACFVLAENSVFDIQFYLSPTFLLISTVVSLFSIYISAWLPVRKAVRISPIAGIQQAYSMGLKYRRRKLSRLFAKIFRIETIIALRSMLRNRRRFFMTIFSLGMGLFLLVLFTCFVSLLSSNELKLRENGPDFTLHINGNDKRMIWSLRDLQRMEDIRDVYIHYPNEQMTVFLPKTRETSAMGYYGNTATIEGVPFVGFYSNWNMLSTHNQLFLNRYLLEGKVPSDEGSQQEGVIILLNGAAEFTKLHVGDEVYFRQNDGPSRNAYAASELHHVKVLAIAERNTSGSNSIELVATPGLYRSLLTDTRDNISPDRIDIYIKDKISEQKVNKQLEELIAQDQDSTVDNQIRSNRNMKKMGLEVSIFLYGFVVVILIIGSLNMMNTIVMNILFRRKEYATLRSIGLSFKSLQAMIVKEGIIYGILSAIFGGIGSGILLFLLNLNSYMPLSSIIVIVVVLPLVMTVGIGYLSAKIALRSLQADHLLTLLKD